MSGWWFLVRSSPWMFLIWDQDGSSLLEGDFQVPIALDEIVTGLEVVDVGCVACSCTGQLSRATGSRISRMVGGTNVARCGTTVCRAGCHSGILETPPHQSGR